MPLHSLCAIPNHTNIFAESVIPACKVHITGAAILINVITKGVDKFRRFDYSNRAQLAITGVLSQNMRLLFSAKSYSIPILRSADLSNT